MPTCSSHHAASITPTPLWVLPCWISAWLTALLIHQDPGPPPPESRSQRLRLEPPGGSHSSSSSSCPLVFQRSLQPPSGSLSPGSQAPPVATGSAEAPDSQQPFIRWLSSSCELEGAGRMVPDIHRGHHLRSGGRREGQEGKGQGSPPARPGRVVLARGHEEGLALAGWWPEGPA